MRKEITVNLVTVCVVGAFVILLLAAVGVISL